MVTLLPVEAAEATVVVADCSATSEREWRRVTLRAAAAEAGVRQVEIADHPVVTSFPTVRTAAVVDRAAAAAVVALDR